MDISFSEVLFKVVKIRKYVLLLRAMAADHDGTVNLEEMRDFMRGVNRPVHHQ
jgi:hypothetical protein